MCIIGNNFKIAETRMEAYFSMLLGIYMKWCGISQI